LVLVEIQPIRADDARGLLPAVLQRMQAQVSELFRFGVGENRHDTALVMKFVGVMHLAPDS
ncbi:MAG TPA: hypothetical protein VEJ00_08435, partial [Candidatus Acidoferrales bacterium]|nr:hypothetical protein [Candidatus Acidoferrales bacterium]